MRFCYNERFHTVSYLRDTTARHAPAIPDSTGHIHSPTTLSGYPPGLCRAKLQHLYIRPSSSGQSRALIARSLVPGSTCATVPPNFSLGYQDGETSIHPESSTVHSPQSTRHSQALGGDPGIWLDGHTPNAALLRQSQQAVRWSRPVHSCDTRTHALAPLTLQSFTLPYVPLLARASLGAPPPAYSTRWDANQPPSRSRSPISSLSCNPDQATLYPRLLPAYLLQFQPLHLFRDPPSPVVLLRNVLRQPETPSPHRPTSQISNSCHNGDHL